MSTRSTGIEFINGHKDRKNAVPAERSFAFFCRRVCKQCNRTPGDTVAQLLEQCPVVRLDAYLYLCRSNSKAKVAELLKQSISEIITPELIACVNSISVSDLTMTRKPKDIPENLEHGR